MAVWFGLFSSGPRCLCGAEVSEQEIAAYTVLGYRGPVYRCEDCWAAAQRRKETRGGSYLDVPNQEPSFSRHGVRDRHILNSTNRRKGI